MLKFVVGGTSSGKSEFAESLVVASGVEQRFYIATMPIYDAESQKKVDKHRKMRATKGFDTIEAPLDLKSAPVAKGSIALLECVSTLMGNELVMEGGAGENAVAEIMAGVHHLAEVCGEVVIVSNQVFADGVEYGDEMTAYLQALGQVNCQIAALADQVYEGVAGTVVRHK